MSYYVHYTVLTDPKKPPQKLVSGPYTEDEVIDKRRDIAASGGVTSAYVSEESKCD